MMREDTGERFGLFLHRGVLSMLNQQHGQNRRAPQFRTKSATPIAEKVCNGENNLTLIGCTTNCKASTVTGTVNNKNSQGISERLSAGLTDTGALRARLHSKYARELTKP
jgi:hypothetical protein